MRARRDNTNRSDAVRAHKTKRAWTEAIGASSASQAWTVFRAPLRSSRGLCVAKKKHIVPLKINGLQPQPPHAPRVLYGGPL